MLALDLRRQYYGISTDQRTSPALLQPHLQYFDTLPYTQSTPSPSTFNNFKNTGYFDAQSSIESPTPIRATTADQYMSAYGFSNPAIRIQQSNPTPELNLPQQTYTNNPMSQWEGFNNESSMAAARSLQTALHRNRTHQRGISSSSLGSAGSGSPYSQGHASYGFNGNESTPASKATSSFSAADASSGFSNSLPTPTQTPTADSFLSTSYPSTFAQSADMNSVMAASQNLNSSLDYTEEDIPGMSHSGRQSVSSAQDPSTPRTIPESYDDGFKVPNNDTTQQMRFPKLDRTVSDAYNDAGFSQASMSTLSQTSQPSQPKLNTQQLAPHRNMINDYLQAAQAARSSSPTNSASRGVSPFRPSSPYVSNFPQMQRPFTAAAVRQAQQARASQMEISSHLPQQSDDDPKTISPKDAVLEYHESEEDAKMPLFSENEVATFNAQNQSSMGGQQQHFSAQDQNVAGLNSAQNSDWSRRRSQNAQNAAVSSASSYDNFATPASSANFHGLPFSSTNYRPQSRMKQESTPEFPAHLTSMESSASEAPMSSQNSNFTDLISKPASSAADSGTYTCTYHGCSLRFETPQKLQKHKREGHRNPSVTPVVGSFEPTPGIGSGMTSAQLAARNSQSGPHKCDRINPTTGKSCAAIFSRPYDLTRHEDTIHNMRKQKVRCALCTEEKTFSRNDALTRHMRVVHPEVDFPGKHRRRGGHD